MKFFNFRIQVKVQKKTCDCYVIRFKKDFQNSLVERNSIKGIFKFLKKSHKNCAVIANAKTSNRIIHSWAFLLNYTSSEGITNQTFKILQAFELRRLNLVFKIHGLEDWSLRD